MSDKLTDEQVREIRASLEEYDKMALVFRDDIADPMSRRIADDSMSSTRFHALESVRALLGHIAELEAANARLPVHDVRVEGGVIVGLGELLEGEG